MLNEKVSMADSAFVYTGYSRNGIMGDFIDKQADIE